MDICSWIFLGGLLVTFALGAIFGFGNIFKFCTGGVVRWILGVWFCVAFGGAISSIPLIHSLIVKGNVYFGGFATILAKLNVATWIYYIILFGLTLGLIALIGFLVKKVFEPKNKKSILGKARGLVNRVIGAFAFAMFWIVVVWVLLAVVELFEDTQTISRWVVNISTAKKSKLIWWLYNDNPIDFTALFSDSDKLKSIADGVISFGMNI